jgi:hypothetical protein
LLASIRKDWLDFSQESYSSEIFSDIGYVEVDVQAAMIDPLQDCEKQIRRFPRAGRRKFPDQSGFDRQVSSVHLQRRLLVNPA